ncbi:MAG: MarR family transcriptional regulator [Gordonia sp. (in: high G+C Gram-positive bacteria)]
MTITTDTTRFELLHALAVKGLASDSVLAAMTGLDESGLAAAVAAALDEGVVTRRDGRISGTMITPAGREQLARLRVENRLSDQQRQAVAAAYTAFLPVNGDFKRVCAAWQMRDETTPNDHRDADYDAAVIADLGTIHGRVDAVLAGAAKDLPRLQRYRHRLADALDRVRNGDASAFARPMNDSYHDVWMELHQDLLLTADRERGADDEG